MNITYPPLHYMSPAPVLSLSGGGVPLLMVPLFRDWIYTSSIISFLNFNIKHAILINFEDGCRKLACLFKQSGSQKW